MNHQKLLKHTMPITILLFWIEILSQVKMLISFLCSKWMLNDATFDDGGINVSIVTNAYNPLTFNQGNFHITNANQVTQLAHTKPKILLALADDQHQPKTRPSYVNQPLHQIAIGISRRKMCKQCSKLILGMSCREPQKKGKSLPDRFWIISSTYLKNKLIGGLMSNIKTKYLLGDANTKNTILSLLFTCLRYRFESWQL